MTALAGRIGPNAITRVSEVMLPRLGAAVTAGIFDRAGLSSYLADPPEQMVDEVEVSRLHCAMREALGAEQACDLAFEAGGRTGDYLLADDDGVIAIPCRQIAQILDETENVMERENLVRQAILNGMNPQQAYLTYRKF